MRWAENRRGTNLAARDGLMRGWIWPGNRAEAATTDGSAI